MYRLNFSETINVIVFGVIMVLPCLRTLLRPEDSNSYITEYKSLVLAKPNQFETF